MLESGAMRREVALGAALGLTWAALRLGSAYAGTEWTATYAASAGYTDNASTTTAADGTTQQVGSAFFVLSPGLQLASEGQRTTHRLSYVFSANLFTDEGSANSTAHQADYNVASALSPRTDLLLSLGAGYLQTNTASLDTPVGGGVGGAQTPEASRFVNVTAGEGLSHELSPRWRLTQGLGVAVFTPTGDQATVGSSFTGTFAFGGEREFSTDRIGLVGTLGAAWIEREAPQDDATQYSTGATLRWSHDFTATWSSELAAGGLYATLASDTTRYAVMPIGTASIGWRDEGNQLALTYTRGATLNPLVAEVFATDDVSLRGGVPLLRDRLALAASIGYQYGQTLIPAPGTEGASLHTFNGDVGLVFALTPGIDLGLRYQIVRQRSDSDTFPDLDRQTALLTVTGRYPDEQTRIARNRFSSPLRMDRDASAEPKKARR